MLHCYLEILREGRGIHIDSRGRKIVLHPNAMQFRAHNAHVGWSNIPAVVNRGRLLGASLFLVLVVCTSQESQAQNGPTSPSKTAVEMAVKKGASAAAKKGGRYLEKEREAAMKHHTSKTLSIASSRVRSLTAT